MQERKPLTIVVDEMPRIGLMYNLIVDELAYEPTVNSENVTEVLGMFKAMSREEMFEWYELYREQKNERGSQLRQIKKKCRQK